MKIDVKFWAVTPCNDVVGYHVSEDHAASTFRVIFMI